MTLKECLYVMGKKVLFHLLLNIGCDVCVSQFNDLQCPQLWPDISVIVNDMSCNRVEETLGNTLFIH